MKRLLEQWFFTCIVHNNDPHFTWQLKQSPSTRQSLYPSRLVHIQTPSNRKRWAGAAQRGVSLCVWPSCTAAMQACSNSHRRLTSNCFPPSPLLFFCLTSKTSPQSEGVPVWLLDDVYHATMLLDGFNPSGYHSFAVQYSLFDGYGLLYPLTICSPKTWNAGQLWNFAKVCRQFWNFWKVGSRIWNCWKSSSRFWNFLKVFSRFWN